VLPADRLQRRHYSPRKMPCGRFRGSRARESAEGIEHVFEPRPLRASPATSASALALVPGPFLRRKLVRLVGRLAPRFATVDMVQLPSFTSRACATLNWVTAQNMVEPAYLCRRISAGRCVGIHHDTDEIEARGPWLDVAPRRPAKRGDHLAICRPFLNPPRPLPRGRVRSRALLEKPDERLDSPGGMWTNFGRARASRRILAAGVQESKLPRPMRPPATGRKI